MTVHDAWAHDAWAHDPKRHRVKVGWNDWAYSYFIQVEDLDAEAHNERVEDAMNDCEHGSKEWHDLLDMMESVVILHRGNGIMDIPSTTHLLAILDPYGGLRPGQEHDLIEEQIAASPLPRSTRLIGDLIREAAKMLKMPGLGQ